MYRVVLKSIIDIIVSFFGLILVSPILLVTSVLLAFQNRGTPFFLQTRPGKHQRAFKIIKFKTMTDERDAEGDLLQDVNRLTNFGKIIRKLSIDELPQLINVLKGDMSLIGPRPLLFKYVPLYTKEQLRRHEVKPGITGWAQVNGRNNISWEKKFKLDIFYIDNLSFIFDIRILWMTFVKVIRREGVNQTINRPMQPFEGSN
jgi:undecaprenyl phosphate N,N'-diacetylbacillosamine 1-phosphate transferase